MDRAVATGSSTKASDQNRSIKLAGDANYAGTTTDKYDEIWTAPTANRTYTFSDPAENTGRRIIVRNIGAGAFKVTVLPNGAEKIIVTSGNEKWELTSFELLQASDWAEFESDGTNWVKINAPYWHKFDDPATGVKAEKLAGWTADQFTPGGLEVTFSEAPIGALATRSETTQGGTKSSVYYRKHDDPNVSNTPVASAERSHRIMTAEDGTQIIEAWLASDRKAEFAVSNVNTDFGISSPIEYYQ